MARKLNKRTLYTGLKEARAILADGQKSLADSSRVREIVVKAKNRLDVLLGNIDRDEA